MLLVSMLMPEPNFFNHGRFKTKLVFIVTILPTQLITSFRLLVEELIKKAILPQLVANAIAVNIHH